MSRSASGPSSRSLPVFSQLCLAGLVFVLLGYFLCCRQFGRVLQGCTEVIAFVFSFGAFELGAMTVLPCRMSSGSLGLPMTFSVEAMRT